MKAIEQKDLEKKKSLYLLVRFVNIGSIIYIQLKIY